MGEQRGNKVFVGGVSWATDEKKFGEHFGPYGEITDCVIMRNLDTGHSRGFGFITFADPSSVDKLFEAGEHVIDGKKLDIKIAVPRDEIGRTEVTAPPKNRRTCKIFVGGISLETSKSDLAEHFGKYGSIVETTVMVDRVSGRPRGFGFVVFQSEDSVDQLLQETHEIHGRKVDCKKAVPREETTELPPPKGARASFDMRDRRSPYDDHRYPGFDVRVERGRERYPGYPVPAFNPAFKPPAPAYASQAPYPAYQPAAASYDGYATPNYNAPSNYNNGPPAGPWDYTSPAYGGAGGGQEFNPYAQPAGYGAARPTSHTARYRPY
jgi:RNA recognition motif-containing protein